MKTTRSLVIALAVGALLLGRPIQARAATQIDEVGWSLGAAMFNIFYIPAKLAVAGAGLAAGAAAGVLTLGNQRAAYAFWVPAAGGTFMLRPEHLADEEHVEFFGSDYHDTPSQFGGNGTSGLYEAGYH
jgi:hypothetical protein